MKKNYLILLESKLSIESIKKRQNQLINDVSHELKTPLTSLILIGERLEAVVSKKDRYLVKRLKKESKRLRKMVEETLELSKLESSETFNINKKISISDLIMESWQTLKPLAEKKDIKINLFIPTKYYISGDIENLKRAFIKIHLGIFNIIEKSSKILLLLDKNFITLLDLLLNILKKTLGILFGLFFQPSFVFVCM